MTDDLKNTAIEMKKLIGLENEPVSVSFLKDIPLDVPKYEGVGVPSGCSFWITGQKSTFYTVANQHHNCPIGTITQGFSIPPEQMDATQDFFTMLVDNQYLSTDDLTNVPKINDTPAAIVYGPLSQSTNTPDAVVIICDARAAMILSEATVASGLGPFLQAMGKPTCAAIPVSIDINKPTLSLGCTGSRVYTGMSDNEMVVMVPGSQITAIVESLRHMVSTNDMLTELHIEKKLNREINSPAASHCRDSSP